MEETHEASAREFTVQNRMGIHTRPAAQIVRLANRYPDIEITEAFDFVTPVEEEYAASLTLLAEGAALAVLVVWLFLRDWRATFVSAVALPLSAIVLETDAPDIPPHWLYRTQSQRQLEGLPQGRNEPAELPQIGAVLANIRGESLEKVASVTLHNALRVLPRLLSMTSLSAYVR